MSNVKKLMMTAAGGEALNVEDVFSTYLYEGNGSTQTITNGIDLSGEGGLVWIKTRQQANAHILFDTERGFGNYLTSSATGAENYAGDLGLTSGSFNSDGFTTVQGTNSTINGSGDSNVSWTFRKAPKFFDVVTYTGNGAATRSISHNLGGKVGFAAIKRTDAADQWGCFARIDNTYYAQWAVGNNNFGGFSSSRAGTETQSASIFTDTTFEYDAGVGEANINGAEYVMFLWGHNDGDGEFGPTGDQDIIKCGSYTGDSTTDGSNSINLGFEPQWIMIKKTNEAANWNIYDNMRGVITNGSGNIDDYFLFPNLSNAEDTQARIAFNATGFQLESSNSEVNENNDSYIYIAIRRGPMAVPESATDVFAMDTMGATSPSPPSFTSGFPVDFNFLTTKTGSNKETSSRLTGTDVLYLNSNNAAQTDTSQVMDYMDGYYDAGSYVDSNYQAWMWRRAPNFFDVVAYTGNGTAGRSVSHNLGVAPEMIWVKDRANTSNWIVQTPNNKTMLLNSGGLEYQDANTNSYYWGDGGGASGVVIVPTDTDFTVGPGINGNNRPFIAYLFASLDGVSKVGSYTGNGSSQTIDCGFSSGARFVLLKQADGTADWALFDTERGIVAGADALLRLNKTDAESTALGDIIDPHSSGFIVNAAGGTMTNNNGSTYIFYAIA